MKNRKPASPSKSAENARKAMYKRGKKKKSDPHFQYYVVIAVFVVVMVAVVVWVYLNPKESLLDKQVIDSDEFLVQNSHNQFFTVGPNDQFEDFTMREAQKMFNIGIADSPNLPSCEKIENVEVPEEYDFRKDNARMG